jgi:hypothetical protein
MPEPTSDEHRDAESHGDDTSGFELRFGRSFDITRRVPDGVLPPDAIARVRAGGELTPEELAKVRAAALGRGPLGRLVGGLLTGGDRAPVSGTDGKPAPTAETSEEAAGPARDGESVVVPGDLRRFDLEWPLSDRSHEHRPATYYEALTGERDPARDFFITARRVLHIIGWVIALGLPLTVILVTIVTGQPAQTVVVSGAAAAVIGLMLRSSFPRTPFG